jgi:HAD superfamily hydrolase (TIGR01509 family)
MSGLKALIFDVDGTLADTERDGHRPAFNQAFAEAGLDWHWDVRLYGELLEMSGGKERIRHYLDTHLPGFTPPAGQTLESFIAGLHQNKTRIYRQLLEQGRIPLRPGVLRLIREARAAGLQTAVATTTTPENVEALLAYSFPPGNWFDVIAAGDCVPAKKPAPDIYLLALELLGCRAGECLALEDSFNGLRSAMDAGLATIITVNDYTRQQEFPGALLVIDQFGEADTGFTILHGDTGGACYLDMNLLRTLHSRVCLL